jgi:hypothetical protein
VCANMEAPFACALKTISRRQPVITPRWLLITTPTLRTPPQTSARCGFACAPSSRALPDAEKVIAYKMPGFRIGQSIVAGYAAFAKQCGLYLSPSAIWSGRSL